MFVIFLEKQTFSGGLEGGAPPGGGLEGGRGVGCATPTKICSVFTSENLVSPQGGGLLSLIPSPSQLGSELIAQQFPELVRSER